MKTNHMTTQINKKMIRYPLFIVALILALQHGQAQVILGDYLLGPNIVPGEYIEFKDPKCLDVYNCENDFSVCDYRTFVQLTVDYVSLADELTNYVDGETYTIEVNYGIDVAQMAPPNPVFTLSAQFNNQGGQFENSQVQFFDYKYFLGVNIQSVKLLTSQGQVFLPLPKNTLLQVGAEVDTYTDMSAMNPTNAVAYNTIAEPGYITLSFPAIDGAKGYDLEWTWIDNEQADDANGNDNITGNEAYDFRNNSTRIHINSTTTQYKIANTYRRGYLLARYRAIGKQECDHTLTSDWNIITDQGYLDDAGLPAYLTINQGHQESMNWQHSRSYAEDLKSKDVIHYFDGSLRNRQTVSKLESEAHSILAETIYDHTGRPAVQVLPSPAFVNNNTEYFSKLDFLPFLNTNSNSDAYNWANFELDQGCTLAVEALGKDNGSGLYYSKDNAIAPGTEQDYVPDAAGFPFTHTVYTQDGTGRVSYQGGVGPDHQIYKPTPPNTPAEFNHSTRYYYGVPSQVELDRLFGSDAGYSQYYQKNMVVDPNGQVSVSYLDNKNRVVATALAGEKPDQLKPLKDPATGLDIVDNLIENNNLTTDNFGNIQYELNHQFLIDQENTDVTVDYSLKEVDFTDPECIGAICFDCIYEVDISWVDDCGNLIFGQPDPILSDEGPNDDPIACTDDGTEQILAVGTTQTIGIGNYSINKILRLNAEKMKEYEELYVGHNTCITSEVQLFHDILINVDFSGCVDAQCATTCITDPILGVDVTAFVDGPLELYLAALEECLAGCEATTIEPLNGCEQLYTAMLGDVAPFGQYGVKYDAEGKVILTPTNNDDFCASIYYGGGDFLTYQDPIVDFGSITVEYNGAQVDPKTLPLQEFVEAYDESWAPVLVVLHPEYEVYNWCESFIDAEGYNAVFDFRSDFQNVDNFIDAEAMGFLDPAGVLTADLIIGNITIPASSPNPPDEELTGLVLGDFNIDLGSTTIFTIWEMAYIQALSSTIDVGTFLANNNNDLQVFINAHTVCNPDRFWEAFKHLYLNRIRAPRLDEMLMSYLNTPPPGFNMDIYDNIMVPGNSICTDLGLKFRHYQLTPDAPEEIPYNSMEEAIADLDVDGQIGEACANTCVAYREDWLAELEGCIAMYPAKDIEGLLDVFEDICQIGCDSEHPLGSSTLPEGESVVYNGQNVTSFEEALEVFLGMETISAGCNANLIAAPFPYDSDLFAGTLPLIDDCVCDKYTHIYTEYETSITGGGAATVEGFALYLDALYEEEITVVDIADIHCTCMSEVSLPQPNPVNFTDIPEPFVCKSCISCESGGVNQMSNLIAEFKMTEYWTMFSVLVAQAGTDDVLLEDEDFRNVLTNWLNNRLHFNLSVYEYLDFLDYCGTPIIGTGGTASRPGMGSILQSSATRYAASGPFYGDKRPGKEGAVLRTSGATPGLGLTLEVTPVTVRAGEIVIATVTITNTDNVTQTDIDFTLELPSGWTYNGDPVPAMINGVTGTANQSQYTATGFDLDPLQVFVWEFATTVPDQIFLSKSYPFLATLEQDTDLYQAEASVYVEIDDPCLGVEEKESDMVYFLNQVLEQYIANPATACDAGILLTNIDGFANSTINLWAYIGYQNLKLHVCHNTDWDANGVNDLTLTFVNSCDLGILCDLTIYNIEDVTRIDQFVGVREVLDLTFDGGYALEVDYRDEVYEENLTTGATSSCYSFVPCEQRRLCNRPIGGSVTFDEEGCWQSLLDLTVLETMDQQETLIDESRDRFRSLYVSQCMDQQTLFEQIDLSYPAREHHYTLYYYDQSGSLYKTIPPKGVKPLTLASDLDKVKAYREDPAGSVPIYPAHRMLTKYAYNSYGQIAHQNSPDAAEMEYWYDYLGRPILSQDGRQRSLADYVYSYTFYDAQGRIIEVGEVTKKVPIGDLITDPDNYELTTTDFINWVLDPGQWISRQYVIRTIYDSNHSYSYVDEDLTPQDVSIDDYFGHNRRYLRKRISSSLFFELITPDDDPNTANYSDVLYDYASHYAYDVHGNVKTLIQEYRLLAKIKQDLKRIDYDYDLISGNVHMVRYQDGMDDQFYHRYAYDADNRLVSVQTSHDKFIWDEDATYTYYDHGPLARTEVGEYSVQGLDYIYTLHGWIKAVNSNSLQARFDPGLDGSTVNPYVGHDAYSYSLDYYDGDYTQIRNDNQIQIQASGAPALTEGLYNGNISRMTTSLRDLNNNILPVTPIRYDYDQLHRIKDATQHQPINLNTFAYNGSGTTDNYKTFYTYDANGNLESLNRYNGLGQEIDRLSYSYYDADENNLLEYIRDPLGTNGVGDIDGQTDKNYEYDDSGNLIKDASEGISSITWDQYGKIRTIERATGPSLSQEELEYHYDAMGNRVVKLAKKGSSEADWTYTIYVRDASGNVMATYKALVDPVKSIIDQLYEREHHIYGSSRLGIKRSDNPDYNLAAAQIPNTDLLTRTSGNRNYELTNHLGNVLSVISDNKLLTYQGFGLPSYKPEYISYSDYYPFGWTKPGRAESSTGYRYGFNGKEKDDEVKSSGVQYDYGFRIYDARIARFMSVDPLTKEYPWYTPYQFAGNKPIRFIDLDGLEEADLQLEINLAVAKIVHVTSRSIGDGLMNTANSINNIFRSDAREADIIRDLLIVKYGQPYTSAFAVSNDVLLSNFEVKYTFFDNSNKGYYLDTKDGFWGEAKEVLNNGLNIASAFGIKGHGALLMKVPGKLTGALADLFISTRKSMDEWVDSATKKAFRSHELDGIAQLQVTTGRKFKPSTTGKGDFEDISSGSIIDHFGVGNAFNFISRELATSQFLHSVDKHFAKLSKGVDELLLDFNNFNLDEITQIKNYIKTNYSDQIDKVKYIND